LNDPFFAAAIDGDRRALARSISRIEDGHASAQAAIAALKFRRSVAPGAPFVLGVTGPPGAGKSTFTHRVIGSARERGDRVAVIAVDPSSPFSGGAILGDRLRMEEFATDEAVFIRSLSSRGHLGGLSRATGQVVQLLDAANFDLVIVETVGVGQSELAVMEVADTVLVVLTPESGDVVQTMKAGLLEVADVFAVNKSDRRGAEALRRNLEMMVHLGAPESSETAHWAIPVHTCSALEDHGVSEVVASTLRHLEWCQNQGLPAWQKRREQGRVRTFLDLVAEDARSRAMKLMKETDLQQKIASGQLSPYDAVRRWTDG
jgi:LAO/AO transport system kinase